MILLNDLPEEHKLRNTRIGDLNCYIQWIQGGPLKRIFPTFKIAKVTYNDLGIAWIESTKWFHKEEHE